MLSFGSLNGATITETVSEPTRCVLSLVENSSGNTLITFASPEYTVKFFDYVVAGTPPQQMTDVHILSSESDTSTLHDQFSLTITAHGEIPCSQAIGDAYTFMPTQSCFDNVLISDEALAIVQKTIPYISSQDCPEI